MKKILTLIITVILVFSLGVCALAYEPVEAQKKADSLNTLGLFNGTENGYELDKPLTRLEALIMLIRLSGEEMDALYPEEELTHPFTDSPDWEDGSLYMAYGYHKGLTNGISATEFAPNAKATLQMYVTYVLRALGYTDSSAGTIWDNWIYLGEHAGILPESVDRNNFLRGDAVIISRAALDANVRHTDKTLKEVLVENYAISEFALSIVEAGEGKNITVNSSLNDILAKVYYGVKDIYPQGLMSMNFEVKDGKYLVMGEEMPKDEFISYLSSFIGADADEIGVESAVVCEPMMSSNAHSVAVIKIKDGTDIEKAKKEIKEKVNPAKWICVRVNPGNVRVESIGNVVLLAMDNTCVDQLTANFKSLNPDLAYPDSNGYLLIDGKYIEADKPFDATSAEKFVNKLNTLKEKYFKDNKVYYATIPEKSYYVQNRTNNVLNHDSVSAFLSDALYDWTQIELSGALSLDSYYSTDRHWRQEKLFPVMKLFGQKMGFTVTEGYFTSTTIPGYKGDYSKKIPSISSENLVYLTSKITDAATVDNYQDSFKTEKVTTVYDLPKFGSKTPYDIFLSGATPLTTIKNSYGPANRKLIIFRDSYGSSIAPLFIEAYSKITLVDLRYMNSSLLPQFVDFENADVLFLLSDSIVNNSTLLK